MSILFARFLFYITCFLCELHAFTVLFRTQTSYLFFDSIAIAVADQVVNGSREFFPTLVDVAGVDFSFQGTEKVIHRCVVTAVAFFDMLLKI